MKKLIVTKKYNGKNLKAFLFEQLPNLSNNLFYKTLRKKDIKINGKRTNQNLTLYENDEVLVYIADNLLENTQNIPVVFEDENILIFNKPCELEVTGLNSLTSYAHKKYSHLQFKPMPCHRIDRNTTGLVLFAKNENALDFLLNKFKMHQIEKHYLALVYGLPKKGLQRCTAFLFKDSKKARVYISNTPKKGYQKIITNYQVLKENSSGTSLLDVQIETGKTHQIRAHLAFLGYPIIGDGKYGDYDINKRFGKKYQMLCHYKLKFNFSESSSFLSYLCGKEFVIEAPEFLS